MATCLGMSLGPVSLNGGHVPNIYYNQSSSECAHCDILLLECPTLFSSAIKDLCVFQCLFMNLLPSRLSHTV